MPIWDANFHRTNEERARARRAAELAAIEARELALHERAIVLQEQMNANLADLCVVHLGVWERFTERMEAATDQMIVDIDALFDDLAP